MMKKPAFNALFTIKYTAEQKREYESQGWRWRPCNVYDHPDAGVWYRYIQERCGEHGATKHLEIMQETKNQTNQLPKSICCKCSEIIQRKRDAEKIKKVW